MSRTHLKSWSDLQDHYRDIQSHNLNTLFEKDPERFEHFHVNLDRMLLDYSKQQINEETISKLIALANECDLAAWRDKMFTGEIINTTEKRAVFHTALRNNEDNDLCVEGENVSTLIQETLNRVKKCSTQIHENGRFKDIINIGIGGSDLGAAMAYEALKPFSHRDLNVHFVSNVDGSHLDEVLRHVSPEQTLFIISSKTFTTQETMTNAQSAKDWLSHKLGSSEISDHFIACTQNVEKANDFGIKSDNIFPIWDWVGGRYSLWSAIGLPLCLGLGAENFQKLLDGAYAMDQHFKTAPFESNMPVMLGLIGVWNRNFCDYSAVSVVPYDQYLWRFPAYLQQLDMESNGKSVDRDLQKITDYKTGPLILGETGTNAQHAYFQLLHQGTDVTPCEFIAVAKSQKTITDHRKKLLANVLAQSKAMMEGKTTDDPNTSFAGNRPSCTVLLDELCPYTLGMLIALYEHKVFVQGVIWNINSFDQYGVELGKVLAKDVLSFIEDPDQDAQEQTDSSTSGLLEAIKNMRQNVEDSRKK